MLENLQSKHEPHRIIYKNFKTYNMELSKHELTIISWALEDYCNSDTFQDNKDLGWDILTKIEKKLSKLN